MPRHPDTTIRPNTALSDARRRLSSPMRPGQCMSRSELADAVNAVLDRIHPGREVTAHYVDFRWVGKLERGEHRWPSEARRAALRQVLGAATDADLDLYSPRRGDGTGVIDEAIEPRPGSWDETIHLLREQWHLLVQNDKMFGPEYALMASPDNWRRSRTFRTRCHRRFAPPSSASPPNTPNPRPGCTNPSTTTPQATAGHDRLSPGQARSLSRP